MLRGVDRVIELDISREPRPSDDAVVERVADIERLDGPAGLARKPERKLSVHR
jgi:hypothetical protein